MVAGRMFISSSFSDIPRSPEPMCDHGLYMFDKGQCETTTTMVTLKIRETSRSKKTGLWYTKTNRPKIQADLIEGSAFH